MNWLERKWQSVFGIEKYRGTINGMPTQFNIDMFGAGNSRKTHYPESFSKYVCIYREVFIVQNVIGQIGKLCASVDFSNENKNDKLVNKLENPNNKQSKQEYIKEFVAYIKSSGWVVVWKRYVSYGNFDTMELINLDPDKTEFTNTGDIITDYDDKEHRIAKEDVIILFDTVREKNGKGYSALRPLRSQIDNILDAQKAKGIQIQNSGITIISPKAVNGTNAVDEGINAMVHPDIPNQVTQKQQIEQKLAGRDLESRYIVSSKGLDANNLGAQLNAVNFDDIEEADKLSICSAFGVDVELTPYGKNATFDNKQQAELSIVQKEATPLMQNLINSLVSEFPGKGNPNVSFAHLDCMSIIEKRIQETNTVRISHVTTLLGSGLIDEAQGKKLLKDIIG